MLGCGKQYKITERDNLVIGWFCTRSKGHKGKHRATNTDGDILAEWK